MGMKLLLLSALLLSASAFSAPVSSDQINAIGLQAIDSGKMTIRHDTVLLFGVRTNGIDTKNGRWACAKVASILLKQSGAMKHVVLGVNQIESELKSWTKIESEDSLRPGDVIIWTRRYKGGPNGACTGGGTCHVCIVTTRGYVHNDPLLKRPSLNGLSLMAFKFKYGLRPRAAP